MIEVADIEREIIQVAGAQPYKIIEQDACLVIDIIGNGEGHGLMIFGLFERAAEHIVLQANIRRRA